MQKSPATGKSPKTDSSIKIVVDASDKSPAPQPEQEAPVPVLEEAPVEAAVPEEASAPEEPEESDSCVVLPREKAWTRVLAYEVRRMLCTPCAPDHSQTVNTDKPHRISCGQFASVHLLPCLAARLILSPAELAHSM